MLVSPSSCINFFDGLLLTSVALKGKHDLTDASTVKYFGRILHATKSVGRYQYLFYNISIVYRIQYVYIDYKDMAQLLHTSTKCFGHTGLLHF